MTLFLRIKNQGGMARSSTETPFHSEKGGRDMYLTSHDNSSIYVNASSNRQKLMASRIRTIPIPCRVWVMVVMIITVFSSSSSRISSSSSSFFVTAAPTTLDDGSLCPDRCGMFATPMHGRCNHTSVVSTCVCVDQFRGNTYTSLTTTSPALTTSSSSFIQQQQGRGGPYDKYDMNDENVARLFASQIDDSGTGGTGTRTGAADCSERTCPVGIAWFDAPLDPYTAHTTLLPCSGRGKCDAATGLCKCLGGFDGDACQRSLCPGLAGAGNAEKGIAGISNVATGVVVCSGHGKCMNIHDAGLGRGSASGGASGNIEGRARVDMIYADLLKRDVYANLDDADAALLSSPTSLRSIPPATFTSVQLGGAGAGADPVSYEGWDRESIWGCVCDEGWGGSACDVPQCPLGADPVFRGKHEIQMISSRLDDPGDTSRREVQYFRIDVGPDVVGNGLGSGGGADVDEMQEFVLIAVGSTPIGSFTLSLNCTASSVSRHMTNIEDKCQLWERKRKAWRVTPSIEIDSEGDTLQTAKNIRDALEGLDIIGADQIIVSGAFATDPLSGLQWYTFRVTFVGDNVPGDLPLMKLEASGVYAAPGGAMVSTGIQEIVNGSDIRGTVQLSWVDTDSYPSFDTFHQPGCEDGSDDDIPLAKVGEKFATWNMGDDIDVIHDVLVAMFFGCDIDTTCTTVSNTSNCTSFRNSTSAAPAAATSASESSSNTGIVFVKCAEYPPPKALTITRSYVGGPWVEYLVTFARGLRLRGDLASMMIGFNTSLALVSTTEEFTPTDDIGIDIQEIIKGSFIEGDWSFRIPYQLPDGNFDLLPTALGPFPWCVGATAITEALNALDPDFATGLVTVTRRRLYLQDPVAQAAAATTASLLPPPTSVDKDAWLGAFSWSITFYSFAEDVPEISVEHTLRGNTGGVGAMFVDEILKGDETAGVSEVQMIDCRCDTTSAGGCTDPTTQGIRLTYGGFTTSLLSYASTEADIRDALALLPNIPDVNVRFYDLLSGTRTQMCDDDGTTTAITFAWSPGPQPPLLIRMPTVPGYVPLSSVGSVNDETPESPFRGYTTNDAPITVVEENVGDESVSMTTSTNHFTLPDPPLATLALVRFPSFGAYGGGRARKGTRQVVPCSNRGSCDASSSFGTCVCDDGYGASDGAQWPDAIPRNGSYDGSLNTRLTASDISLNCGTLLPPSIPTCPGGNACSGHGRCTGFPDYICACRNGWTGRACTTRNSTCLYGPTWFDIPTLGANGFYGDGVTAHRQVLCSGHGSCASGACRCDAGWVGLACEMTACPSSASASSTTTTTVQTTTTTDANGTVASYTTVTTTTSSPESSPDYNVYTDSTCGNNRPCVTLREFQRLRTEEPGTLVPSFEYSEVWDADVIRGCMCEFPLVSSTQYVGPAAEGFRRWTGYDCNTRLCPMGPDPQDVIAMDRLSDGEGVEVQQIKCTLGAGNVRFTFRGVPTKWIRWDAWVLDEDTPADFIVEGFFSLETVLRGLNASLPFQIRLAEYKQDPVSPYRRLCDPVSGSTTIEIRFAGVSGDIPNLAAEWDSVAIQYARVYGGAINIKELAKGDLPLYECNRRGVCAREGTKSGTCTCQPQFGSSDGFGGGAGQTGDCGYRNPFWGLKRKFPPVAAAAKSATVR